MRKEADLLILDEPTNDLDIPSLEVLEQSLLEFPGAVLLVTHDRWLLERVSTDLLALDGEGGAFRIKDTAQWEDLAGRITAARSPSAVAASAKAAANPSQGLSKPERRELERMEQKIFDAESAVSSAEMVVNRAATDPIALERACADLAKAQSVVEKLYARWAELEAKAKG